MTTMTTPAKSTYAERFTNRVAVVTGGASGVGFEIATRIAAEGGRVSLWDRDPATLAKAAATVGDRVNTVQVDVTDAAKLAAAADNVFTQFGRIDVLVGKRGHHRAHINIVGVSAGRVAASHRHQ